MPSHVPRASHVLIHSTLILVHPYTCDNMPQKIPARGGGGDWGSSYCALQSHHQISQAVTKPRRDIKAGSFLRDAELLWQPLLPPCLLGAFSAFLRLQGILGAPAPSFRSSHPHRDKAYLSTRWLSQPPQAPFPFLLTSISPDTICTIDPVLVTTSQKTWTNTLLFCEL